MYVSAVLLPIEEVDLVFAMCSVSGLSNQSFELMKDTVKSIVDNYGTSKVHYTVVIYGTQALATAEFSDKALTKEDVKEYIDSLPKPRGTWFADGRYCHCDALDWIHDDIAIAKH